VRRKIHEFYVHEKKVPTVETVMMKVWETNGYKGQIYVCMYKGWAIKLALAPLPLMIYCASLLATAMIITVAALRIVLAHGSKPL
jgi:hypothetical protein